MIHLYVQTMSPVLDEMEDGKMDFERLLAQLV